MRAPRKFRLGENPLWVALFVSACATVLSYAVPRAYSATAVGFWFLTATYVLTLRKDAPPPSTGAPHRTGPSSGPLDTASRWGLSLGGLLEPAPLDAGRLARATARAAAYATALALLTLPPFWIGFVLWYGAEGALTPDLGPSFVDEALGQLLVIALPEEAFFRGYLQTSLEARWPAKRRLFGAPVGWAIVVTSAVFAVGHLATAPDPARLAVFFPSLAFGWLRARTGGIGAGVLYHASCNVFASFLGRSYGLFP